MSQAIRELTELNEKTTRRTQAIQASMGLLSAVRHATSSTCDGEYALEARECEYEVDLMLDAIAERVVDEIERRAKARKRGG